MHALSVVRSAPLRLVVRVQSAGTARPSDAGMTTAEYAVGTVGACGFGGVLYTVITSDPVRNALKSVLLKALSWGFG